MTARERLRAVQRELIVTLAVRAAALGGAATLAVLALGRQVTSGAWVNLAALLLGIVTTAMLAPALWRARSLQRVALWIEERHPALRYAVVTASEGARSDAIEQQALGVPWWKEARRWFGRKLIVPIGAIAGALALFLFMPDARDAAAHAVPGAGNAGATARRGEPSVLARIRVSVTPPAYARRAGSATDDPTSVEALVASRIVISGDGDARRVIVRLDSATPAVESVDGGWSISLAMPGRPALIRLDDRAGVERGRLIVLAPVIDAPPGVVLLLPARDTVVRAATGAMALRAQLRDDIGLRDARFELVVSSGEGENFTFRSAVIGAVMLGGTAQRTLEGRLSLDSLALKPGDVLQLRAVARDANTATGPGVGSSDTRSLRVARQGEYDSVSVDPAPPGEPDGQVLSQRMLINLTQALDRRRPRMARSLLLTEAGRIAVDQARLRKRVGDIVFQRVGGEPLGEHADHAGHDEHALPTGKLTPEALLKLADQATQGAAGAAMEAEGDETPILAVNKPLLEAFNAMWDAGRALEQGETNRALPPMRRALAAIERARQAERIYLRGRPNAVVIDIARARLAGKDKGTSTLRDARHQMSPIGRRRALSFARATALLGSDAAAAADTLLVMRVDALETAPALAAALDAAAGAVRRGDAAAVALAWQAVRRALGPPSRAGEAGALWSGAP